MTDQKKNAKKQEEKEVKEKVHQDFFGDSDHAYINRKLRKQGFIRGTKVG